MKPPICSVCHRDQRDNSELDFKTVRFTDYEAINHPGHPKGLHWICSDHIDAARSLEYLSSAEAIERLRRQFES